MHTFKWSKFVSEIWIPMTIKGRIFMYLTWAAIALSVTVDMPDKQKPKAIQEHRNVFCTFIAKTTNMTNDEMEVTIALKNIMKKRLLLMLCLCITYQAVAEFVSTLLRNSIRSHKLAIMIDSTPLRLRATSPWGRSLFIAFSLICHISAVCAHQPNSDTLWLVMEARPNNKAHSRTWPGH